jgi:hypothetical protein
VQVAYLDAFPAAPEKLQIGVAFVSFKPALLPTLRLVALNQQIHRVSIHVQPPGFARSQPGHLAGDAGELTGQTILQERQPTTQATARIHESGQIVNSAQHGHI